MRFPSLATALALAATTGAASAHITLEYPVAQAASHYKATFKVGHGCGASPIKQIVVHIPEGVRSAKPMPKAGWMVQVGEGAKSITWTARTPEDMLPNAFYDEFVLQARLPDRPGALYWSVSQVCEAGRVDWAEVPKAGQLLSDLKSPAAYLEVLPAGAGGHHH